MTTQAGTSRVERAFSLAIDPVRMQLVFARHVRAGTAIAACQVTRYRHRPGQRVIVQYLVHASTPEGAHEHYRITGQWYEAGTRAERVYHTLTSDPAVPPADWRAPFAPVFFDEETAMLATTFPWDRRLTALPRVAAGDTPNILHPMLDAMGVTVGQYRGCTVDTVRYREQLSAVCGYTVRAATPIDADLHRRFFVKTYADDEGARVTRVLEGLARATAGTPHGARVQPAVAYLRDLQTLIVPEAPGTPLHRLLADDSDARDVLPHLEQAASALLTFSRTPGSHPDLKPPRDHRRAFERARDALIGALPDLGEPLSRVCDVLSRAHDASDHGLSHGDVKLEHIFIDGSRVWLIDLDSAHRGDRLWDVALLRARWWVATDVSPQMTPLRDAGCATIDRLIDRHTPPGHHADDVWLRALALVDVAAGLVKRQEPEWPQRARRVITCAASLLGDRQ